MKTQTLISLPLLVGAALALPARPNVRREVPQEHSHEQILRLTNQFLKLNNPDNIQDAVFGLLGNAAASEGQGNIADTDCLQQATADRAFTNAKAAGDVNGQVAALLFRALERNTGQVGLKSVLCTAIKAVNPEIAAITQHQDPASENAAATNKGIALELAKQIASVGGNPLLALNAGTFAPGEIGDPTAAGNTCNDAEDPIGCIFTLNRLVADASPDEIQAAAGGNANAGKNAGKDNGKNAGKDNGKNAGKNAGNAADRKMDDNRNAKNAGKNAGNAVLDNAECPPPARTVTVTVTAAAAAATETGRAANEDDKKAQEAAEMAEQAAKEAARKEAAQAEADKKKAEQAAKKEAAQAAADKKKAEQAAQQEDMKEAAQAEADKKKAEQAAKQAAAKKEAAQAEADKKAANAMKEAADKKAGNAAAGNKAAAGNAAAGAIDLGECADPSIVFGVGFDGRTEASFQPKDKATFSQGSAQNINIITNFICGQLQSKCKANQAALNACVAGAQAAAGLKDQAAADAFNAALGV